MRTNRSRINTGKIASKIRIRIIDNGVGYSIGTILNLPAGARQVMLSKRNALGNKVAEIIEEPTQKDLDEVAAMSNEDFREEDKTVPEFTKRKKK